MPRKRGLALAPPYSAPSSTCDCGGDLTALGTCSATKHYPLSQTKCLIACPLCRRSLAWSGACDHCHGTRTFAKPETWTFPGDRYEVVGQHRVRIATGPRKACTPQENAVADGVLGALLRGELTVAQALGALDEVMAAHGGLEWELA